MTPAKRTHILLIEDHPEAAEMVKCCLEPSGYTIHVEGSGKDGLSYAWEHQPDLVILDLKLPDLHGYEVCEELRRLFRGRELPILMLTVMNEPMDRFLGISHGADVYLTKPFEPAELRSTVERLLRGEWIVPDVPLQRENR